MCHSEQSEPDSVPTKPRSSSPIVCAEVRPHLEAIFKARFGHDRRPSGNDLSALMGYMVRVIAAGAKRPGGWEWEIFAKLLEHAPDELILWHPSPTSADAAASAKGGA